MQADIRFSWWRERHQRDYKEIEPEAFHQRPSFGDSINDRVPRIIAKGVCLERYEPLKEWPDLYERFARLRTQSDAVKFIRTFGPLTAQGLPEGKGDSLYTVLRQAESMAAGNLHIGLFVWPLNARLITDHGAIRLEAEPADLADALWLQFAEAKSKGLANLCKQCKELFATGPETRRRKGAQFCSVECKIKHHSLKRSR